MTTRDDALQFGAVDWQRLIREGAVAERRRAATAVLVRALQAPSTNNALARVFHTWRTAADLVEDPNASANLAVAHNGPPSHVRLRRHRVRHGLRARDEISVDLRVWLNPIDKHRP